MTKKLKPAECPHLIEDRKLIVFDADPNTSEVIEKTYECAGCGKVTAYKFRAPNIPRPMTGGPRPLSKRLHS